MSRTESPFIAHLIDRGQIDGKQSSRIQRKNRAKITEAAIEVFSVDGYRGATLDRIAKIAKISKPNLIYYYSSKEVLYLAVLHSILEFWLQPFEEMDEDNSMEEGIGKYIDKKMEFSRLYPTASRVFSKEISAGAPLLKPMLKTYVRDTMKKKTKLIKKWMGPGKLTDPDPFHIIIAIWAITQHYADFEAQIEALTGKTLNNTDFFHQAKRNVRQILLHGILGKD